MSDNLVTVCLVLILLDKLGRTGKSNLRNVLFHLFRSHADSVIAKTNRLLLRLNRNRYSPLKVGRLRPLSDERQLLQLRYRIRCIGNLLTNEDILVAVHPLFDDGENIFTMNR